MKFMSRYPKSYRERILISGKYSFVEQDTILEHETDGYLTIINGSVKIEVTNKNTKQKTVIKTLNNNSIVDFKYLEGKTVTTLEDCDLLYLNNQVVQNLSDQALLDDHHFAERFNII